jgi:hypothetical protein
MSNQFVGYWIDPAGEGTPVATGKTLEEARSIAIRRVLSQGIVEGSIGAKACPNITAGEFATLTAALDRAFKEGVDSCQTK